MQRYYRLTISLDVSIAFNHLIVDSSTSKNEFDFFDVIYLYDQKGLDTQYNVLQWLVEPADLSTSDAGEEEASYAISTTLLCKD
ncbi:hypothetical protein T01_14856 [Trichinella spiralis]|uniref:Uncharacterized protein n=1 Tax=Trichinella spiralis TaxID=6334 RepID=A0A0V1BVI0_TRISP|nr:hypothetical protein T01_14856 [Trichinella spiralis]